MIGCFKNQVQPAPNKPDGTPSAPPGTFYILTPRNNALTIYQDGTVKENGPNVGDREWIRKAAHQPSTAYDVYLADRRGYQNGYVFQVLAFDPA